MADFLSRLAARAMGSGPTAQPVIPPAFAPGPRGESGGIQELDVEEVAASGESAASPAPVPAPESTTMEPVGRPVPIPARLQQRSEADSSAWERGEYDTGAEGAVSQRPGVETTASASSLPIPEGGQAQPTFKGETGRRRATKPQVGAAAPIVPVLARSNPSDSASLPKPNRRQQRMERLEPEPPASAIRVTIGRIEVRAILPAAQAPVRTTPAVPKGVLTLEEYTKQRNRR